MTLKELYEFGKNNLPDKSESLLLITELYGYDMSEIILRGDTNIINTEIFLNAVQRRKTGEPIQYILGYWYFGDLKLSVKKGVLIPREDTLVLVEKAVKYIKEKHMRGVDLCSGSGAVALAVANECKNAVIDAVELYDEAFSCLLKNTETHSFEGVSTVKGDIFDEYLNYKELDFIVSNPPYIETNEIPTLQREVGFEPKTALDGGDDGLVFYRLIADKWLNCLKKGGLIAVEIGETQAQEVAKLFEIAGVSNIEVINDFNGLPRVVAGIK